MPETGKKELVQHIVEKPLKGFAHLLKKWEK